MIKSLIVYLFLAIPVYGVVPSDTNSSNQEYNIRGFYRHESFNSMAEVKYRSNESQSDEQFFTLGTRYRLYNNLKVGAFYQLATGQRHDADWVKEGGVWTWKDTKDRREDIIIIELLPRYLMDFLPGEKWVFDFRIRGKRNFFNDNNTLILRPGISYYWFSKGAPFINFYFQHEIYFPLNYSNSTIYQRWTYIGLMYHINKQFKISPYLTFGFERWGNTDSFKSKTTRTYEVEDNFNNIGVSLIVVF